MKLTELPNHVWKCSCQTLNTDELLKCKKCNSDRDVEKNKSKGLNSN